jgi:hypothetical protein
MNLPIIISLEKRWQTHLENTLKRDYQLGRLLINLVPSTVSRIKKAELVLI